MGEYSVPSENVPLKPGKKMSFLAKFFIGLLIFILLLPFILIGVIYAMFYDPAHKDIKIKENFDIQEVFNEVLVDSLDYAKPDKKVNLRLTEDNFNNVLGNAIKGLSSGNGVVRNLYLEISETQYNFVMEINTWEFFKTRVILNTKLDITDSYDGAIKFQIKNIRVGRIDGMEKPIKWLLGVLPIGDIQSALSGSGLNFEIDINNLKIELPLKDVYDKIEEAFGASQDSYSKLFREMVENADFHTFETNANHALQLTLDLEKMVTTNAVYGIEDYVLPAGYFDGYMSTIPANTASLLNESKIAAEDATVVAQYQVGGLNGLSTEEKTKVQPYIDSGVISEPTDPYPYHIDDSENLTNIAKAQIQAQLMPLQDPIVVDLTTTQIDRMLSQSKNLGSIALFKRDQSEDGSTKDYKANYVLLNRITSVTHDDNMFIVLTVSVNGRDVNVTLKTERVDSDVFGQLRLKIKEMTLGDIVIGEEAKQAFIELIDNVTKDGAFNDLVTIDKIGDDQFINISLKKLFNDDLITDLTYDFSTEVVSQTASDPGHIIFKATKKTV